MIVDLNIKNCYIFEKEVTFSMKADMRNKKFGFNVYKKNNLNILKTAGIYGTNNSGKTCLIKCIRAIKNVLLNENNILEKNFFSSSNICELGIIFLYEGKKYSFEFKYDTKVRKYIYEKFAEIIRDGYGNEKEICWLKKDRINNIYHGIDEKIEDEIRNISAPILIFNVIDNERFEYVRKIKEILIGFANKICVVDMNEIPITHTIELLKNKENRQKKVVEFIKNADLYLENIEYGNINEKYFGNIENIPKNFINFMKLSSTYKGIKVPSILYDSIGTKKITALASYIIEAIEEGKVLVIDELDSSLHFVLTRAIVSMFNNELNKNAQLIFTVHDINLMDCKKLFRKEQIWFVHKDNTDVYVYSLADFKAKDGVRDTSDIIEKYKKGILGALPEPNLIEVLLELKEDDKSGS